MGFRRIGASAALFLVTAALFVLPARADDAPGEAPQAAVDQTVKTLLKDPATVDMLLRYSEPVLDALRTERARDVIAQKQRELLADSDDLVAGNPAGDVALVEFFDYRCPYCKEIEPALEALFGQDRELRFVYKEFPVLGPASVTAARAALAARRQGKYAAFHREMMALKGQIDDAAVFKVAGSVGLDLDRLKRDMATPEIDRALKANI